MKNPILPKLSSMVPKPKPRGMTKLKAHAHRLTEPAFEDYDEEPSTKLSTAFVVVLMLHLIAVGGIYAFHSIKVHRREADGTAVPAPSAQAPAKPAAAVSTTPAGAAPSAPAAAAVTPVAHPAGPVVVKPATERPVTTANAVPAPASGPSAVIPAAKPPAASAVVPQPPQVKPVAAVTPVKPAGAPAIAPEASGKTYTVVKGDNPVAIAHRFSVSYEELLKINGLDDPRKLQIGQVLKLPVKKSAN